MKLGYDNEHEVKAKIKYMGKLKKKEMYNLWDDQEKSSFCLVINNTLSLWS